jgi:hypothetical protein
MAVAAAILAASGCAARQARPFTTPEGWVRTTLFTTPDGRARIQFPGPPKENRTVATRVAYAVYNAWGSYLLSVFSREEGAGPAGLPNCRQMMRRGGRGTIVEEKRIQMAGREGIECRFSTNLRNGPHPSIERVFRLDDREYVVSASPRRGKDLPPDALLFLDSFEMLP